MSFDIKKYAETAVSYSFLKGLDGDFAPNRVVYDRAKQEEGDTEEKEHFRDGKIIETAVLRPDEFDQRYKVCKTKINPDTKSFQFVKAYRAATIDKEMEPEAAAKEAMEYSRLAATTKIDTLIKNVAEDGKWMPIVKHLEDWKDLEPIDERIYGIAMKHRDRVHDKHNPLRDILEDSRCLIEPHLEWENMATGVKCHGYPDVSIPREIKVDLKALVDVSNKELNKPFGPIKKFNFIPQLAAYDEADPNIEGTRCYIYAMEKHELANWNMKRISDSDLYAGLEKFNQWCAAYKFLNENDLWHMGYEFSTMYAYDEMEQVYRQINKVAISETNLYW